MVPITKKNSSTLRGWIKHATHFVFGIKNTFSGHLTNTAHFGSHMTMHNYDMPSQLHSLYHYLIMYSMPFCAFINTYGTELGTQT